MQTDSQEILVQGFGSLKPLSGIKITSDKAMQVSFIKQKLIERVRNDPDLIQYLGQLEVAALASKEQLLNDSEVIDCPLSIIYILPPVCGG